MRQDLQCKTLIGKVTLSFRACQFLNKFHRKTFVNPNFCLKQTVFLFGLFDYFKEYGYLKMFALIQEEENTKFYCGW